MTMVIGLLLELVMLAIFPPAIPGATPAEATTIQEPPAVASRPSLVRTSEVPAPAVSARAAGVWDPATKEFLHEKSVDMVVPIASITKLMTVLVALDANMDAGRTVAITSGDNDPEGARLPIPNGGVVTVQDLFAATLIASANNAAEALVRATGMNEAAFVAAMNGRASELGMSSTRFTDVTGLGSHNESSVRDLVVLANEAFSRPFITELTTTKTYDVVDQSLGEHIQITNTNSLVGSDLRIVGGKTGYTDAAAGALLTRIRGIGEQELIIIVLESDGREQRFRDLRALADWAFATHMWRAL